jgi:murein DD-endopeptidase MepM/ murein hydrolase activator NlpD
MTADGEPVSSSDPDKAARGGVRSQIERLCSRACQAGVPSRLVLHGCFLILLVAGLRLCQSLPDPTGALRAVVPDTAPAPVSAAPQLVNAVQGGIGGEVADVLISAVVPRTTIPRRYRIDPVTYTVQSGDNVSSIADQFGVSAETVLWNNGNLEDNPDYLDVGDDLTILPVSGVYHTVVKGDTLESIAKKYKVKVEDITGYEGNYMVEPYTITTGQKLIVPGGKKPYQVRHVVAWSGSVPKDAKRGTGTFGWPVSGYITQRYSEAHPAVDIGVAIGNPVKASDSGYVAVVGRSDTGYGRYILVDHGNGFQSVYAHLSVIYVEVGQSVGKGQTMGLSGNTGKSTGPHLHFEIKLNGVRRNPFIYLK